jgi:uncharacterized membrane protein YfbV (UPF0208 family)
MIDEAERQEIINAAVEKALLLLPETVGNLIASHAALSKINTKFYSDYPEFKDKKDIVASVVEMVEGKNTFDNYESILKKAIPEIRKRINVVGGLDLKNVSFNPNLDFKGSGEI